MKLATYLAIAGAIAVLFGLAFLLVPGLSLQYYAMPTEPHNLMQSRYFGGTLLAYGLIFWLARATRDDGAISAMLQAATVGNIVGLILSVWMGLSGLANAMIWGSVAIYALLLLGSVYFLAIPAKRA